MGKSYGFIEITGVVAAINALDIMCKTADVELASWERKLGGRLVTIIVQGDVAAVTEAVEAAATHAIKKPASYAVIANPHEEIVKMVELSASRWRKKKGDEYWLTKKRKRQRKKQPLKRQPLREERPEQPEQKQQK